MANLEPLRREDLPQYEPMFSLMEERAGFVPNAFLTMARRPGMLDALQALIQEVFAGSVSRETKSLVALMSSYGAGCRYCQAHQAASLVHQGMSPEKFEAIADFERILTGTDACLTRQYQALLATENVQVDFTKEGIRRLAEIAFSVNEKTENIGARRLYTVMEKLLEEISFAAGTEANQIITIDAAYVDEKLGALAVDEDLSRYVL